jgi:hypothetical protein
MFSPSANTIKATDSGATILSPSMISSRKLRSPFGRGYSSRRPACWANQIYAFTRGMPLGPKSYGRRTPWVAMIAGNINSRLVGRAA